MSNLRERVMARSGADATAGEAVRPLIYSLFHDRFLASTRLPKGTAWFSPIKLPTGGELYADEATALSTVDESYESLRYRLGERPRDSSEAGDEYLIVLRQRRPS